MPASSNELLQAAIRRGFRRGAVAAFLLACVPGALVPLAVLIDGHGLGAALPWAYYSALGWVVGMWVSGMVFWWVRAECRSL